MLIKIFWQFINILEKIEYIVFKNFFFWTKNILNIWQIIYIEWLVIQILAVYILIKLIKSNNYLNQLLCLMLFLVLLCINLSFLQLELFACFLFLAEFTIAIFFYCLYLHLKASIDQNQTNLNTYNNLSFSISILLFIPALWYSKLIIFKIDDVSILFIDIYKIIDDFTLNDLSFLYYYMFYANPALHLIIASMLFVITLLLFLIVSVYTLNSLNKRNVFAKINFKILSKKGYYEQTGFSTQKIFMKKEKKDKESQIKSDKK